MTLLQKLPYPGEGGNAKMDLGGRENVRAHAPGLPNTGYRTSPTMHIRGVYLKHPHPKLPPPTTPQFTCGQPLFSLLFSESLPV